MAINIKVYNKYKHNYVCELKTANEYFCHSNNQQVSHLSTDDFNRLLASFSFAETAIKSKAMFDKRNQSNKQFTSQSANPFYSFSSTILLKVYVVVN